MRGSAAAAASDRSATGPTATGSAACPRLRRPKGRPPDGLPVWQETLAKSCAAVPARQPRDTGAAVNREAARNRTNLNTVSIMGKAKRRAKGEGTIYYSE